MNDHEPIETTTATPVSYKSIASALASAQAKMGKALKSANNPHFKSKYADLASVTDACLPALNEAGIAVIQPTTDDDNGRYVETILIHGESGEVLKCRVPLIVSKNDMQGYGSAVTYARRYGLMSMSGIAPEDDDGNRAAKSPPQQNDVVSNEQKHPTWAQTVTQDLPPTATPRDKAEAIAAALIASWARKPTKVQLGNEWEKHKAIISSLEERHPDLHAKVCEAFDIQEVANSEAS